MHYRRVPAPEAALATAGVSFDNAKAALLLCVCGLVGAGRLLYHPGDLAASVGDHPNVCLLSTADDLRLAGRVSVG